MKKLAVIAVILSLAACQKEVEHNTGSLTTTSKDAFVMSTDTVFFQNAFTYDIDIFPIGRKTGFGDLFTFVPDTIFVARLLFTVHHSGTTHYKGTAAIGSFRSWEADGYAGAYFPALHITTDTFDFRAVKPMVVVKHKDSYFPWNSLGMTFYGTGKIGDWYQMELISALFTNKAGQKMVTKGLPELGNKVTYIKKG